MRVRVIRDCYTDRILRQGEEFNYDGPRNENLQEIKPEKRKTAKDGEDDK